MADDDFVEIALDDCLSDCESCKEQLAELALRLPSASGLTQVAFDSRSTLVKAEADKKGDGNRLSATETLPASPVLPPKSDQHFAQAVVWRYAQLAINSHAHTRIVTALRARIREGDGVILNLREELAIARNAPSSLPSPSKVHPVAYAWDALKRQSHHAYGKVWNWLKAVFTPQEETPIENDDFSFLVQTLLSHTMDNGADMAV